ncbi:MAG: UDP-N-acetylglucosamine 2-epimerase [Comamonadaceae bacterium]|nr:UDP-N-acetylglucosamine 2-epimerase [Comamonadaceae bacterium]
MLVVGDVNSTLACTLVAVKKGVPVVHVEAGLRSYDRAHARGDQPRADRPDRRPALHHRAQRRATTCARGRRRRSASHFVGNVMIDSLLRQPRARAPAADTLRAHGIDPALLDRRRGYGVVTLHRPSNVDDADTLRAAAGGAGARSAARLPLVFALHPRTRANIERFGLRRAARPGARGRAAAAGLPGDARPDGRRHAGAHRLRRPAGGDHRAGRALPDAAREHRAPDHGRAGHQHAGRPRPRGHPARRWTRSWPAAASAGACPSSGTAAPPSASPPTCGSGCAARRDR